MARPKAPLITRDAAVRAALEIIDRDDLSALSLERLAQQLGVKAPSLYHHFSDKADILASVAHLIMREAKPVSRDGESDWKRLMVNQAVAFRHAILDHPNAAPLMLEYLPRQLMIAAYERLSERLTESGVPTVLHMLIFEGVDKLTLGSALYASSRQNRASGGEYFPGIDPVRDPYLSAAVESVVWDEETLFANTVYAFLNGVLAFDWEKLPDLV